MNLKFEMQKGILVARASGDFTLHDAQNSLLEILKTLESFKTKKVLVDCFQLKGVPSMMEYFKYSDFANDELAKPLASGKHMDLQIAYVGSNSMINIDKFGEAVAADRADKAKAFDNMDDAINWLGIGSTKYPP